MIYRKIKERIKKSNEEEENYQKIKEQEMKEYRKWAQETGISSYTTAVGNGTSLDLRNPKERVVQFAAWAAIAAMFIGGMFSSGSTVKSAEPTKNVNPIEKDFNSEENEMMNIIYDYIEEMSTKKEFINSEYFKEVYEYFTRDEYIDFIDIYGSNIDEVIKNMIFEVIANKIDPESRIKISDMGRKGKTFKGVSQGISYSHSIPYYAIEYVTAEGVKEIEFDCTNIKSDANYENGTVYVSNSEMDYQISNIYNVSTSIEDVYNKIIFAYSVSNGYIKEGYIDENRFVFKFEDDVDFIKEKQTGREERQKMNDFHAFIEEMNANEEFIGSESFKKVYDFFDKKDSIDVIDIYESDMDETIKKVIFETIENKMDKEGRIKVVSIDFGGWKERNIPYYTIECVTKSGIKEFEFSCTNMKSNPDYIEGDITITKEDMDYHIENIDKPSKSVEDVYNKIAFAYSISNGYFKEKDDNWGFYFEYENKVETSKKQEYEKVYKK